MSNGDVIPNRFGPDTRHDFHVLKDGDLFAVFPANGEINARDALIGEARSKDGLFFRDTRYLSRLSMSINGTGLVEMGHDAHDDDGGFRSDLANTRLVDCQGTEFRDFDLHVRRDRFLSDGLFDRIEISNFGTITADLDVTLECWADYRDIFEVRGADPSERGEMLPTQISDAAIQFGYLTADGRRLTTIVRIDPTPELASGRAHIRLSIAPKSRSQISLMVQVAEETVTEGETQDPTQTHRRHARADQTPPQIEEARRTVEQRIAGRISRRAKIRTSNSYFDAWLSRSSADLAMLTTDLPTGPYPYAGIPWFAVPFGRDGLIAALQLLWLDADLAGGVLDFLAATQATQVDAFCDAEPGKILHEHRNGEMARTGAVPFHRYYGGIDQTLLFVVLANEHWKRTGDRDRLTLLEPSIRAAMEWAATYGEGDGTGFIQYERSADTGLRNQGWKDSEDSVFHADGTLCDSPVALVEVQGYYVAALRAAASLFTEYRADDDAQAYARKAESLVTKIDDSFWDDNLGTYCIALDGQNRRVRVSASNPGHLPFFGAVLPKRLNRLFETLCSPALRSGWGIRTMATDAARYNPMGYHNGSVWPHDNSLIAAGASRCGNKALARQITTELFDASCHFPEHRLPELWCGLARDETARPVAFPSACSPQAWAAGSAFLCIQACLGIHLEAGKNSIRVNDPVLPKGVDWLELRRLRVGEGHADIAFRKHGEDQSAVEVEVLGSDPGIEIDITNSKSPASRTVRSS